MKYLKRESQGGVWAPGLFSQSKWFPHRTATTLKTVETEPQGLPTLGTEHGVLNWGKKGLLNETKRKTLR